MTNNIIKMIFIEKTKRNNNKSKKRKKLRKIYINKQLVKK